MSKRALLVMSMSFVLALGAFTAAYAEGGKAMPAKSPTTEGPPPEGFGPPDRFRGRWHHGPSLKAIMNKLGITPEQKTKIRGLYVAFRNDTRKPRMELMSLKDQKQTMILSGKIDQQKLAQIDDQIVKLRGEVLQGKLKLKRDRLALLTPEQLNRIADWKAEKAFRSGLKKRHHRGGMHGMMGGMMRGDMRGGRGGFGF